MKKTLPWIIMLVLLLIACAACFVGCDEDGEQLKLVVLGDSIAEGLLGPSPLTERDNYSYCAFLGKSNNFIYHNRAVSAHETGDMLNLITQKDTSAFTYKTHIKEADVIVISILGNDYIHTGLDSKALEYAKYGTFTEAEEVLVSSRANINQIVQTLKTDNPDATLIFQTVYNPFHKHSQVISHDAQTVAKRYLRERGESEDLYLVCETLLDKLNGVLFDYLKEHPGAFHIADVNAEFERLYKQDNNRLERLIYDDSIHPSSEGHAVIADVIQAKLVELGLVKNNDKSLKRAKEIRIHSLERLYENSGINLREAKRKIKKATSFPILTKTYFDIVEGHTPAGYALDYHYVEDAEYMDKDTTFYITGVELKGLNYAGFLKKEESYIQVNADGTATLRATVSDKILNLAKDALLGVDTSMVNLEEVGIQVYSGEIFPGTSILDVEHLLDTLYESMGMYVDGIDFEEENIIAIAESIRKTGNLPEQIILPDNLALVIQGRYFIKHFDSLTNPEGFDAVCFGNADDTTDPFFMLTFGENEKGEKTITYYNGTAHISITATAR